MSGTDKSVQVDDVTSIGTDNDGNIFIDISTPDKAIKEVRLLFSPAAFAKLKHSVEAIS